MKDQYKQMHPFGGLTEVDDACTDDEVSVGEKAVDRTLNTRMIFGSAKDRGRGMQNLILASR